MGQKESADNHGWGAIDDTMDVNAVLARADEVDAMERAIYGSPSADEVSEESYRQLLAPITEVKTQVQALYQDGRGDINRDVQILTKAESRHPGNPLLLIILFDALCQQEDYLAAEEVICKFRMTDRRFVPPEVLIHFFRRAGEIYKTLAEALLVHVATQPQRSSLSAEEENYMVVAKRLIEQENLRGAVDFLLGKYDFEQIEQHPEIGTMLSTIFAHLGRYEEAERAMHAGTLSGFGSKLSISSRVDAYKLGIWLYGEFARHLEVELQLNNPPAESTTAKNLMSVPPELEEEEEDDEPEEQFEDAPEYKLADGVRTVVERIESLLAERDYVVVSIASPGCGNNCFLAGEVGIELKRRGIAVVAGTSEESLEGLKGSIDFEKKHYDSQKCVIIFYAMGSPSGQKIRGQYLRNSRETQDIMVDGAARREGLPPLKVNLRVFTYKPGAAKYASITPMDRKFADIVVFNEEGLNRRKE